MVRVTRPGAGLAEAGQQSDAPGLRPASPSKMKIFGASPDKHGKFFFAHGGMITCSFLCKLRVDVRDVPCVVNKHQNTV